MQQLIVLFIVLLAAFFIGRRFWRFLRPGRRLPCSAGCCGCSGPGRGEVSCNLPANNPTSPCPPGKEP